MALTLILGAVATVLGTVAFVQLASALVQPVSILAGVVAAFIVFAVLNERRVPERVIGTAFGVGGLTHDAAKAGAAILAGTVTYTVVVDVIVAAGVGAFAVVLAAVAVFGVAAVRQAVAVTVREAFR